MEGISNSQNLVLQVIATGMHLSPEFGLTYREIEDDGFTIDSKVEMLLSSDTPVGVTKSMGMALIGLSEALERLKPDIVLVLGDRFEILAAAIAATNAHIPLAHLHGGETTEGAADEAFRHAITKMAWWHFVAAKPYLRCVVQLGEDPKRVFLVGGLGVDAIMKSSLLSKKKLRETLGLKFSKKNLLVTFHPVTLEQKTSQKQFQPLLDVLDKLYDTYVIFTMPNADVDGRIIKSMIEEYVRNHADTSIAFTTMGQTNYYSALQYVDALVGNSSSGIAEAPSFKIGTINIGDRQKGRLRAKSVIDCEPNENSIMLAFQTLYNDSFQKALFEVQNPYGGGFASEQIVAELEQVEYPNNLKKTFYDS